MNDPLGNAFKSVVPEPPSTQGWVAGARRKRRNRQLAVSGAVGAVLAAVAVPLALNLPQFNSPIVASPEPTVVSSTPAPTETPSPSPEQPSPSTPATTVTEQVAPPVAPATDMPGAAACFDENNAHVGPTEGKPIERGAERAWLCGDAPAGMGTVGPVYALTTNVDRIVDFFEAQPAFDASITTCGYEYSTVVTVVLEYPDGSTSYLQGAALDCMELTDGVTSKASGDFVKQMVNLWQEQRQAMASVTPVLEAQPILCPPAQDSLVPAKVGDGVAGVVCSAATAEDAAWVEIPVDLAKRVAAEAATATEEVQQMGTMKWVVLHTAWGDQIALERQDDGTYQFRDGDKFISWAPSESIAAELDALFP